ncbi:hypothetical protein [Trichlorobacter thiogenes]|nr:hypothetical protein [Trichlorobacter thiogenes]
MTFSSITIESVGRDGRAHKTVLADGTLSGGHLSGMPPRIYRNEGRMPADQLAQLSNLMQLAAELLPNDQQPQHGQTAPTSYRRLTVVRQGKPDCSCTASGETRFAPELLEQIYTLLAAQKVGGW